MKKAILLLLAIPILITGCASKKTPSEKVPSEPSFVSSPNSAYDYYVQSVFEEKRENYELATLYLKKALEADPESVFLGTELCLLLVEQNQHEQALAITEELLVKNQRNVDILILHGRINHILKRYETARNAYTTVLEIDPNQEDTYLLLGAILTEKNELEEAITLYQKLVRYFPGSYAGYFLIGKIRKKQNKDMEALSSFERAIELQPALVEARFELADLYKKNGDNQKAIQMYKEIITVSPGNVRAQLELALLYQKAGRAKEAGEILYLLGKRSAEDTATLRKIIRLYIDTKNYEQAIFILTGMLKGAPESSDLYYVIGVAEDERGNWRKSIESFQRVEKATRFYENAVVHISYLTQQHIGLDAAIKYLEDIVSQNSDNTEFLLYLGSFYEEKKMYARAVEILNSGLSSDPANIKLRFRLGVVYDKWGKKDACIAEMKTVIAQDPKDHHALNYLGYTYADLGIHLDEAENLIRKALSLKPDDGYITDSLGWVYYQSGRYQEAVDTLEKARSLVADDPVILEHLGDAYHKIGKSEKALEMYRKSLVHKKDGQEELEKKIRELKNRKESRE